MAIEDILTRRVGLERRARLKHASCHNHVLSKNYIYDIYDFRDGQLASLEFLDH